MNKTTGVGALVLWISLAIAGRVAAVEVSGVAPGNGGDALSTTFHFNFSNTNKINEWFSQLTCLNI